MSTTMPMIRFCAALFCLTAICAEDAAQRSEQDRLVIERYIGHMTAFADGLSAEKVAEKCAEAPEMFAWVEFPHLDGVLDAHALTGDVQYLDRFTRAFALFRSAMTVGDDGHLGWYGKAIQARRLADQPDLQIDELQMNFRAIAILARWVDAARQHPAYAQEHAEHIRDYLALMEQHLFPKWDTRGFFVDLGSDGGVYRGLDYPLANADNPGVTLSFEKTSLLVEGLLRLHRVSGNPAHLQRAIQLGTRFKRCLHLVDDHYEWMSWDPAGAWDKHPQKDDAWRVGWIAPDPKGGWYAASVSIAVSLYHHGLVFDDADMQRFLLTQKTRCWNGDLEHPVYRTVAGVGSDVNKHVSGRFLAYDLATHDPLLSQLAFSGPHEAGVLEQSTNAWKGGVGLNAYIFAKHLLRPRIAAAPQPYLDVGKAFLDDPVRADWYRSLHLTVVAPGRVTPLTPSAGGF